MPRISMGGWPGRCMIMRLMPTSVPVMTVKVFMTISPPVSALVIRFSIQ